MWYIKRYISLENRVTVIWLAETNKAWNHPWDRQNKAGLLTQEGSFWQSLKIDKILALFSWHNMFEGWSEYARTEISGLQYDHHSWKPSCDAELGQLLLHVFLHCFFLLLLLKS